MAGLKIQKIASEKEIKKVTRPSFWREFREYLFYFLKVFLSVAILYIFIRTSVFDLIGVSGKSMFPNYNETTKDDSIYIDQLTPKFSEYKRGDVIVIIAPVKCDPKKSLFIKRVIGLPGEQVVFEGGKVFIINKDNPAPGIELNESAYLSPEVKTYKKIIQDDGLRTEEPVIPENKYFFMGDNRSASTDGRVCGPIDKGSILGKEFFRLSPASKQSFFRPPSYNIGRQN